MFLNIGKKGAQAPEVATRQDGAALLDDIMGDYGQTFEKLAEISQVDDTYFLKRNRINCQKENGC